MIRSEMEILLLGPLEVRLGGRALNLGGSTPRALLAVLAVNAGRVMPSERLIELLWGEEPPHSAGNALQVHVSGLRKLLEPKGAPYRLLLSQAPGYVLKAEPGEIDSRRFEQLAEDGHQALQEGDAAAAAQILKEAGALWRGTALAGLEQEPWVVAEAHRLEELRVTAEEDRIEAELLLGRHSELVAQLAVLVAQHPLRERLCSQLMLALYRSGRQAEASTVYYQTRELLVDQLGMEPGPALQQLLKQILNQDSTLDVAVPAINARRLSKLPRYRDALVGRRQEMEQLADRLEASSMVTLTGPGGIGKTRLAIELSAMLSDRYLDGVVFVDLSPLTDESLVPRTIISALGLRDDAVREPMEVITTYLEPRSLLLVLDNCEHLLTGAAAAAAELLRQCPNLIILTTSREALGVSGETIWEVPSLPSRDDPSAMAGFLDINAGDAVDLFRVRAEAAAPKSFIWNESVLIDATKICHKLDGIPLAIELAAARVRVIPAKDLLAGLSKRFALLTTGSSTAIPRQRSLEATVDWSYELLSPSEQTVLGRLAVFAGGFSPDAAEAVCADDRLRPASVIPTLFSLVEKSLIRHGTGVDGSARYSMLETIREYSRNKLRARAASADVDRRHAAYFSALASPTELELRSAQQVEWLAQLEQEYDNFRTAIEWALDREPLLALEIVTNLEDFWMRRHAGEGSKWVTRALAAAEPTGELRARAVEAAGRLAYRVTGDREPALSLYKVATEHWTHLENWPRAARATGFEGLVEDELGDHELGFELMNRAVELLRRLDDPWNLAYALNNLAYTHFDRGDSLTAKALLDDALRLALQYDYPWLIGALLDSVAEVEEALGLRNEARAHLEECLALAVRLDDADLANSALLGWGRLALVEDNPELCIRLMAAGDAALTSIGAVPHAPAREGVQAIIKDARSRLSDSVADKAWHDGQAMTVHELIALVARSTATTSEKIDSGGRGTREAGTVTMTKVGIREPRSRN